MTIVAVLGADDIGAVPGRDVGGGQLLSLGNAQRISPGRIPAEAFLRMVYGRLDPAHTPGVELSGPVTLDDLRAVFPGT